MSTVVPSEPSSNPNAKFRDAVNKVIAANNAIKQFKLTLVDKLKPIMQKNQDKKKAISQIVNAINEELTVVENALTGLTIDELIKIISKEDIPKDDTETNDFAITLMAQIFNETTPEIKLKLIEELKIIKEQQPNTSEIIEQTINVLETPPSRNGGKLKNTKRKNRNTKRKNRNTKRKNRNTKRKNRNTKRKNRKMSGGYKLADDVADDVADEFANPFSYKNLLKNILNRNPLDTVVILLVKCVSDIIFKVIPTIVTGVVSVPVVVVSTAITSGIGLIYFIGLSTVCGVGAALAAGKNYFHTEDKSTEHKEPELTLKVIENK